VYVPVDFEHDRLGEELRSAGFDFGAQALFSWIGVTMYLTLDAIRETLAAVAAVAAGTQIVLTYNLPTSALQDLGQEIEPKMRKLVAEMGEPMVSLFTPAEIQRVVREAGFVDVVHIGPDEAREMYFPGRSDVQFGGAQRLIIATVG
jgi:O-methyltransferase involved in polyketide biosynthesis